MKGAFILYFDLKSAFDAPSHSRLIECLKKYNFNLETINIITLLLNNLQFSINGNYKFVQNIGTP